MFVCAAVCNVPVNVPPVIAPVVVIVLEPVSILPKPLVIDPAFNAPVPVMLVYDPLTRATGTVPLLILSALIAATLNVPNVTISTTSPLDNALAKTTEVPDVTVTSVPFTIFTPFRYTSRKPASYAKVLPPASAKPVPDAPVKVVGVPVILYVNLSDVPLTVEPAAAQPLDL